MRELLARAHALLRRLERAASAARAVDQRPPIRLGDVEVDLAERRVRRAGEEVHLAPTEFDLLVFLASRPRAVLSRERLLAEVWDWAEASGARAVDSHVMALRRKLGADLIRAVHGVGCALEWP
jgi:DNA-binding response OmpR family regulator